MQHDMGTHGLPSHHAARHTWMSKSKHQNNISESFWLLELIAVVVVLCARTKREIYPHWRSLFAPFHLKDSKREFFFSLSFFFSVLFSPQCFLLRPIFLPAYITWLSSKTVYSICSEIQNRWDHARADPCGCWEKKKMYNFQKKLNVSFQDNCSNINHMTS